VRFRRTPVGFDIRFAISVFVSHIHTVCRDKFQSFIRQACHSDINVCTHAHTQTFLSGLCTAKYRLLYVAVQKLMSSALCRNVALRIFVDSISGLLAGQNVQFLLQNATKSKRGNRGIALLLLQPRARRGWEISTTSRRIFPRGKVLSHLVQEGGWDSGPVPNGRGKFGSYLVSNPRSSRP
jgi:hypothetical protein